MLDTRSQWQYFGLCEPVLGMLGGMGIAIGFRCVEENVSLQIHDPAVFPTLESAEPRVWRSDAACRDTQPDLFFPVGRTGQALEHIAKAQEVCKTCAVQVECLEYALMTNQDAGIWGGLTEDDRRKIRRERRKANRAAQAAAAKAAQTS